MGLGDDLAYLGVRELAARIRDGELSALEVTDATLERIEARNPTINALVYLDPDGARDRAREADEALRRGEGGGPLHGVPTAIKDLFDSKPGWPTTFGGIPALRDFRVDAYCGFAERIEQAGAIIVGKGNSPVLGFNGATDNELFGPTRNPFDPSRNAGGSSGGCAAAVADGLFAFAEGTDGGGSIRIPASWCGIYGLKPTFGRVPFLARPNAFASINPFAFEGPLTRSVEDAALVLGAIAGPHPRDPLSAEVRVDFMAALQQDIGGLRIGYTPNYDVFPVDRRVAGPVTEALAALSEAGAQVEEIELGIERDHQELAEVWMRLISAGMAEAVEGLKRQGIDLLGEDSAGVPARVLDLVELGHARTTLDVAADQEVRTEILDLLEDAFERCDVIVGPTLSALPVENSEHGVTTGPAEVEGVAVDELIGWCPTFLINFTGHPAASVPAGLAGGLPVGMQVIGRRYADADVLAVSAALERQRPWRDGYQIPARRPLD